MRFYYHLVIVAIIATSLSFAVDNLIVRVYNSSDCKDVPQAISVFDLDQVYMRNIVRDPNLALQSSSHSCHNYLEVTRNSNQDVCTRPDLRTCFTKTYTKYTCSPLDFDPNLYFKGRPYLAIAGSDMADCSKPLYGIYLLADGSCIVPFKDVDESGSYRVIITNQENNTVSYSSFDSVDCSGEASTEILTSSPCSNSKTLHFTQISVQAADEPSLLFRALTKIFPEIWLKFLQS